jgi:acetolactate synthase-1/2/3 large subunit
MSEVTAGRTVVELLKAEQVKYIFGIVGSTFLDVLDALYDDRSVEYINVRHEQAAAFMADGLARVTDAPGVCLVTSGPGATNLLTGVAAAYVAHSPVVVLVGGVSLDHYAKDVWAATSATRATTSTRGSSAPRATTRTIPIRSAT